MTKNLTWRLSKLPTVEELQQLVKDKIITKEEAKDVLFKDKEKEDVTKLEALKEEIKFLKELVQKLADNDRAIIIKQIKIVKTPYYLDPWYRPYQQWVNGSGSTCSTSSGSGTATLGVVTPGDRFNSTASTTPGEFTNI